MLERFIFWLEGIFEDDPLPDEIRTLVFITHHNGKFKYLELKGYEGEYDINAISFCPLEAQFYSDKEIENVDDKLFCIRAKSLIEEAFDSEFLSKELKNRKIYFKFNEKPEFLFQV